MSSQPARLCSVPVTRLATPRDHIEIARLFRENAREQGVESYVSPTISVRIKELITSQKVVFVVAGTPLSAVASIHFRHDVWTASLNAQIEDVFVSVTERQQGYGRAIMTRALELIRSYGAQVSSLTVNENNRSALGLYQTAGFKNSSPSIWQNGRELTLTLFHQL